MSRNSRHVHNIYHNYHKRKEVVVEISGNNIKYSPDIRVTFNITYFIENKREFINVRLCNGL